MISENKIYLDVCWRERETDQIPHYVKIVKSRCNFLVSDSTNTKLCKLNVFPVCKGCSAFSSQQNKKREAFFVNFFSFKKNKYLVKIKGKGWGKDLKWVDDAHDLDEKVLILQKNGEDHG